MCLIFCTQKSCIRNSSNICFFYLFIYFEDIFYSELQSGVQHGKLKVLSCPDLASQSLKVLIFAYQMDVQYFGDSTK